MQVEIDPYQALAEELQQAGLVAERTRADQLSVATQEGPTWSNRKHSVWLSQSEGAWYLSTWLPVCYRVPHDQDLVSVCATCAQAGISENYRVRPEVVDRFQLQEIDAAQQERLFPTEGWND